MKNDKIPQVVFVPDQKIWQLLVNSVRLDTPSSLLPMQQSYYGVFSNKQKWLLLIVFIDHKKTLFTVLCTWYHRRLWVYDGRNIDCHETLVFMSITYNNLQTKGMGTTVWSSYLWKLDGSYKKNLFRSMFFVCILICL